MDTDKKRLHHRLNGSGKLSNPQAEAVCYLLAKGHTDEVVCREQNVTQDQLQAWRGDKFWTLRFDYLKANPHKQKPEPKSHAEYMAFALKKLCLLTQVKAGDSKSRIAAAKALGELAHTFSKDASAEPKAPEGDAGLLRAFNEGK